MKLFLHIVDIIRFKMSPRTDQMDVYHESYDFSNLEVENRKTSVSRSEQ